VSCIKHEKIDYEVDCLSQGKVARSALQHDKEGGGVSGAVGGEPGVLSLVAIFVWFALPVADLNELFSSRASMVVCSTSENRKLLIATFFAFPEAETHVFIICVYSLAVVKREASLDSRTVITGGKGVYNQWINFDSIVIF